VRVLKQTTLLRQLLYIRVLLLVHDGGIFLRCTRLGYALLRLTGDQGRWQFTRKALQGSRRTSWLAVTGFLDYC
jgi:hypothetical protein